MSTKRITRPMLERTLHIVDGSGILDLLAPPPKPGQPGRRGMSRENTRLWLIGVILCTRLGHETTIEGVHSVLTQTLSREVQWELGILRPLTTLNPRLPRDYDPEQPRMTTNGKPRKEIWVDQNIERIGYDDLHNAVSAVRKRLDYGYGSQPDLDEEEREQRRATVEEVLDRLIGITAMPRTGTTVAIDGTGQWGWNIGPGDKRKRALAKLKAGQAKHASEEDAPTLEVAEIATDDDGATAPQDQSAPAPAGARGRCLDAAWGYKTSKAGKKEVGFGFHQHTAVRTPDPGAPADSEPLQVEGIIVVPANEDVVAASLRMLDRAASRGPITRVIGDTLYTNLKPDRWAVPLAQRGIEQVLTMGENMHGVVDISGAQMQFGWLHCPSAPMDQRPLPAASASEETEEHYDAVDAFRFAWAFDRKESGLGKSRSTKWICPARAGRVGCWALDPAQVETAMEQGLPIITPPADWRSRACCTNTSTIDFTPDPTKPYHQRKLMQREYYGDRRWRRAFNLRSLVEGVFGILKNPSRQRMRRGHNRLPGLAMANIINGLKVAVFNEEQARGWHERTGRGPVDHPLLQSDPYDWGFTDLTKAEAAEIDATQLKTRQGIGGEAA